MKWKERLELMSKAIHNKVIENMIYYAKSSVKNDWLGFPPATDEEIKQKEELLGVKLPNSYKEFLKVSNGFLQISHFSGHILPVSKIDWIGVREQEFVEIMKGIGLSDVPDDEYFVYGDDQRSEWFRDEYLINSIAISEFVDGSIVLLNPNVWYGEECEAWLYASWYPGAYRYKSFEDLMEKEYQSTLRLLLDEENESD
jgi:hypothetical protein